MGVAASCTALWAFFLAARYADGGGFGRLADLAGERLAGLGARAESAMASEASPPLLPKLKKLRLALASCTAMGAGVRWCCLFWRDRYDWRCT